MYKVTVKEILERSSKKKSKIYEVAFITKQVGTLMPIVIIFIVPKLTKGLISRSC